MLLRHASAGATAPESDDHDRPLSRKGYDEAERVGAHLASCATEPSLILCSSAKRAVETADRVAGALPGRPRLQVERAMYLAGARAMLDQVTALADAERAVLVVAHNPGIQALALHLACDGSQGARARMATRFAAASLAVFELPISSWADADRGGRLAAFTHPGDLAP